MPVKKKLEVLEMNIEKDTKEVNCLKMGAEWLKSEIEREKTNLKTLKQKGKDGIGGCCLPRGVYRSHEVGNNNECSI